MSDQASSKTLAPSTATPPISRVFDSKELFAGSNAVLIRHDSSFYRLLRTKNGKLILQK